MDRLADVIICALILIIMFLADYTLKQKNEEGKKRNIEIARIVVSTASLIAILIVVFII